MTYLGGLQCSCRAFLRALLIGVPSVAREVVRNWKALSWIVRIQEDPSKLYSSLITDAPAASVAS